MTNTKRMTIKVDTLNEAFANGNCRQELVRILRNLTIKLDNGSLTITKDEPAINLFDINGNSCGTIKFS